MRFSKNITGLGKARPLSAKETAEGVSIVSKSEVAIIERIIPKNSMAVSSNSKVISYADECFLLNFGKMHKRGGLEYESD